MENYCNFKPFDKVLVRYDDQHVWQIDFFSHYVRGVECPYKCLTRDFNQCIPYNGNEHLIDTTNEPSLPKQTEQSQTQTKETMWKPKNEEIVFSLKVTKDFRFTSTKLEWANNDKVLQIALEQGVIFRYADEALELCRKINYLIDNFKNSENEK